MFSKKKKTKNMLCPRCKIKMTKKYMRSFGEIGPLFECPKCKGLVEKSE